MQYKNELLDHEDNEKDNEDSNIFNINIIKNETNKNLVRITKKK